MPIVYGSGKARQSRPRTAAWSLQIEFHSPPMYCPGDCTRGSTRLISMSRNDGSGMGLLFQRHADSFPQHRKDGALKQDPERANRTILAINALPA